MEEWTEKHRGFEIGEAVVIHAKESSRLEVHDDNGKRGIIHSIDCPMDSYRVDFSNGLHVIVSPFEIEPLKGVKENEL